MVVIRFIDCCRRSSVVLIYQRILCLKGLSVRNIFLFLVSCLFLYGALAQGSKQTDKRDDPIKVYEKEQSTISSCIKSGGTPRTFTEQNGCRNVSCTYPQSERNCVHLVGNPNGANCTPGFCK